MSTEDRDSIERQLRELSQTSCYIEKMRKVLLSKTPQSDQDLKLAIFEWHHIVENIFDNILITYINAQNPEQEVINSILAHSSPVDVCKDLIFSSGFDRKLELIGDTFGLSKSAFQLFKTLGKFRNGLAHRYKIEHRYFEWKKKNVLTNGPALEEFITSLAGACSEILQIDKVLAKYFEDLN